MTAPKNIIEEARERLSDAKAGLDLIDCTPDKLRSGFRNVATFGAMVTFALNNLRHKIDGFEEWDADAKRAYLDNPSCRMMRQARNAIEKQAKTPVTHNFYINSFSTEDLARFPKPKGAVGFFMGDRNGGSGWTVRTEDGHEVPFYIDLPADIGFATPIIRQEGFEPSDLRSVVRDYLGALEGYISAVERFVDEKGAL